MDLNRYLSEEGWRGSYFELALELGPAGDDVHARRALDALWQHVALAGPWDQKGQLGAQPIAPSTTAAPQYGCLSLHDGTELGCLSWFIREEPGSDWLDLSIPTGMLEHAFAVAYPLDSETNLWIPRVEQTLVDIAVRIFAVAPFRLALIGEEASGACSASELTAERCEVGGLLVPKSSWEAHSPKRIPELVAPGLVFAPFKRPHITFGV